MLWHVEMLRSTTRVAVALVCVLVGATPVTFAGSSGPFAPWRVFVEHTFFTLDLQQGALPTTAFASKHVACPARSTRGCSVRVKTSIDIWDVPSQSGMREWVLVSGRVHDLILLEPTRGGMHGQRTCQFVIQHIDAGSTVTIDIQLENLSGTAHAGDRVETVDLLLN